MVTNKNLTASTGYLPAFKFRDLITAKSASQAQKRMPITSSFQAVTSIYNPRKSLTPWIFWMHSVMTTHFSLDWIIVAEIAVCFTGEIDKGGQQAESLITTIADFQPEAVILWCPTCHCRFDTSIAPALDIPFKIMSFPQYLAANMKKLSLSDASAGVVTLHEPCKSVYTGLDCDGPREVLRQLPGVTLTEMEHHGPETRCCGSGAACWFQESSSQMRDNRLQEADQTGADRLVTVCHYCGQTFGQEEDRFNFEVINYVNLVTEAMGIKRDDTFKKYALWRDLDRILNDTNKHIQESPFEKEKIIKVLQTVFTR